MTWIVAAATETPDLPEDAVSDFKEVAKANPAAPWRLETGHLRGGRELLEEMTGRSWEEVDMTADEVKTVYETLHGDDRYRVRPGMASAVIAFLGVCAKHGFGLEGGVGARRMRR
jgi:hypothetical protein